MKNSIIIKTSLLFIVISFTYHKVNAQETRSLLGIELTSYPDIKEKGPLRKYPLGIINNKLYTFGRDGKVLGSAITLGGKCYYNVHDINNGFEIINKGKQERKVDNIKLGIDDFKRTVIIGDKIVQPTSGRDGSTIKLSFVIVNPEDFSVEEIKNVTEHNIGGGKDHDLYEIHQTHDGQHFIFCVINAKGESTELSIYIYNKSLELVHEITEEIPFTSLEVTLSDFEVYDDGNVFFILNQNGNLKGKLNGRLADKPSFINIQYNEIVYRFNDKQGVLDKVALINEEYNYLSKEIKFYNDKVYITGIYETFTDSERTGTYCYILDKNLELIDVKHEDFTFDFATQYYSENSKKNAIEALEEGKLNNWSEFETYDIFLTTDGFIQYSERLNLYTERWDNKLYNRYKHYEIILIKYDFKGNVQWKKTLPKSISSTNDRGQGALTFYKRRNDKVYFIYRDWSPDPGDNIYLASLDLNTESIEKKVLFSTDNPQEKGEISNPGNEIVDVDENTILIKSKKRVLGRSYGKQILTIGKFK